MEKIERMKDGRASFSERTTVHVLCAGIKRTLGASRKAGFSDRVSFYQINWIMIEANGIEGAQKRLEKLEGGR